MENWLTLRHFTGHIYAEYCIEVVCPAAPSCQFWCNGCRVAKTRVVTYISPTWHGSWFENLLPSRHIQVHIYCLTDELYQISDFLQNVLIIIKQNHTLHSNFGTGLKVILKNWEKSQVIYNLIICGNLSSSTSTCKSGMQSQLFSKKRKCLTC